MLQQGLKFFTDGPVTVLGLLIFFLAFAGILSWTFFRAHSKSYYQKIAELPLQEEQV